MFRLAHPIANELGALPESRADEAETMERQLARMMTGTHTTYAQLISASRTNFERDLVFLDDVPKHHSALACDQDLALHFCKTKLGKAAGPYQLPPELLAAALLSSQSCSNPYR